MEQTQTSSRPAVWVGGVIGLMAGVVAITPLGLTLAAGQSDSTLRTALIVAATITWILVVFTYRGLARASDRQRRKMLRREVAEARRARLEAADAYQDKLRAQRAILDRIVEISGRVLEEGIIDPQLALKEVRLIRAHATTAQSQVEDGIIEARVGVGAAEVAPQTINLRNEIEEIASAFAHGQIGLATGGPVVHGDTDPAMFRLIVRSLISAAVARAQEDVDVTVARNGGVAVCTVSDDGPDCSRAGLDAVSALAHSLTATVDGSLEFNRVLGRNQFSIAVASVEPAPQQRGAPMDVLGTRRLPSSRPAPVDATSRTADPKGFLSFPEPGKRDRNESVAARRERQPTAG